MEVSECEEEICTLNSASANNQLQNYEVENSMDFVIHDKKQDTVISDITVIKPHIETETGNVVVAIEEIVSTDEPETLHPVLNGDEILCVASFNSDDHKPSEDNMHNYAENVSMESTDHISENIEYHETITIENNTGHLDQMNVETENDNIEYDEQNNCNIIIESRTFQEEIEPIYTIESVHNDSNIQSEKTDSSLHASNDQKCEEEGVQLVIDQEQNTYGVVDVQEIELPTEIQPRSENLSNSEPVLDMSLNNKNEGQDTLTDNNSCGDIGTSTQFQSDLSVSNVTREHEIMSNNLTISNECEISNISETVVSDINLNVDVNSIELPPNSLTNDDVKSSSENEIPTSIESKSSNAEETPVVRRSSRIRSIVEKKEKEKVGKTKSSKDKSDDEKDVKEASLSAKQSPDKGKKNDKEVEKDKAERTKADKTDKNKANKDNEKSKTEKGKLDKIKSDGKAEKSKSTSRNEKQKNDRKTEKSKGDDKIEKCKGDDKTEKSKGDDKTEKSKGDDKIEKSKGDDKIEKSKGDDKTEKSKGDDKTEKSKGDDKTEKPKGDDKIEKAKVEEKIDSTKLDVKIEKSEPKAEKTEEPKREEKTDKIEQEVKLEKTDKPKYERRWDNRTYKSSSRWDSKTHKSTTTEKSEVKSEPRSEKPKFEKRRYDSMRDRRSRTSSDRNQIDSDNERLKNYFNVRYQKSAPRTQTTPNAENSQSNDSPEKKVKHIKDQNITSENTSSKEMNPNSLQPPSFIKSDMRRDDDMCTHKPEKVKSRWRRSSELERGELSGNSTPTYAAEFTEGKSPVTSLNLKDVLYPIAENQVSPSVQTTVLAPISVSNASSASEKEKEKPPHYEAITENICLFERKRSKSKKEVRRMVCDCSLTKEEIERGMLGCEEDCLNRLLMIECGSRCVLGDLCSNKRFQKKKYVETHPFKTARKGWGLKTLRDLPASTFVMEYVGEVLSPQEFKQRVKHYAREKNNHYYFMALKSDEIIDATVKGNLSRFINHSCSPNCETQKWTVNGELRIGFFTKCHVKANEELTFDYQFQRYGKEAQKCHCESSNCRGSIGEDKQISFKSYRNSSSKKRKTSEEKKREILEDITLEEEIEKLSGGLRNREHTLTLARLMVQAEETHARSRLLDIIQNTTEQACLRLFLDYHGLSLLWSWMADIGDKDLQLKAQILEVLSSLPVTNKTMLLDSKVMNVVQRWSFQLATQKIEKDETEQSSEPPSGAATPKHGDNSETSDVPSKKLKLEEGTDSDASDMLGLANTIVNPPVDISTIELPSTPLVSSCNAEGETPSSTELLEQDQSKQMNPEALNAELSEVEITSVKKEETTADLFEKGAEDEATKTEAVAKSDEESRDTMDEEDEKRNVEIANLASKLLESWSELKEVFRIPRLEQQKRREDEREADRKERERGYSRYRDRQSDYRDRSRSSERYRDHDRRDKDYSPKRDRWHRDRDRDRDRNRDHDRSRSDYDYYHDRRSFSAGSPEWHDDQRHSKSSKKQLHVEEEVEQKPKKILLPTPQRMSKEERRQLFALEVQQRDEEEAVRRQQEQESGGGEWQQDNSDFGYDNNFPQYYEPSGNFQQPVSSEAGAYGFDQQMSAENTLIISPQAIPLPEDCQSPAAPAVRPALLPTPTFIEPACLPPPTNAPNMMVPSQIPLPNSAPPYSDGGPTISYPQPGMVYHHPHPQGQNPPFVAQPPACGPAPPVSNLPIPSQTPIPSMPAPSPQVHIPNPSHVAIPPPIQQQSTFQPPSTVPVSQAVVPPPYIPSQPPYMNPQSQPLYYVQPSTAPTVVSMADQSVVSGVPVVHVSSGPSIVEEGTPPSPPKPKPVRLPPNWKTAKDAEGNVYYYHCVTRQTQWDPPVWEEGDEDMDLGTPTYDEPKQSKKKGTTTAAADTSSEVAKKIKELFRTKISGFIVQCLNPYRKPDCKLGRINSTEEFKHLARKLTHFVMAKELKHCKIVEDLECNDNVKHKAKDFIHKYMSKFGAVYKKEKTSPKND